MENSQINRELTACRLPPKQLLNNILYQERLNPGGMHDATKAMVSQEIGKHDSTPK